MYRLNSATAFSASTGRLSLEDFQFTCSASPKRRALLSKGGRRPVASSRVGSGTFNCRKP